MAKSKRELAQGEKKNFWQDHLQGWRKEGSSKSEYCRRHNLSRDQFNYWKKKLALPSSSSLSLVPVSLRVNQIISKPLVVVVADRYRIEVSTDFESAVLGKLVQTLERV